MIFKYIHYIYTYHVYTQYTHVLSLHVAVHNMWMMPQRDGEICSACFLKQNLGIHKGLVSQKIGISWDIPFYVSTGSIFVTFSLQMLRQHLLLEFAVFLVSHIQYIYICIHMLYALGSIQCTFFVVTQPRSVDQIPMVAHDWRFFSCYILLTTLLVKLNPNLPQFTSYFRF